MPRVVPDVELQTHDEIHNLRFSSLERADDGSGYSCMLHVRSGGFSCEVLFTFDNSHFPEAIANLKRMDTGKPGKAIIKGIYGDDCIRFESNDLGHVEVSGELHEHTERHQMLKFGFRTDQTTLGPLVSGLSGLLKELDS